MSTTISGELYHADTKDAVKLYRRPRTYNYTLRAAGGGNVRFKAEAYIPPMVGEIGTSGRWTEIEDRSSISSGTTATGSFTVPTVHLSSEYDAEFTEVKFIFSRGVLTEGSEYELFFEPA